MFKRTRRKLEQAESLNPSFYPLAWEELRAELVSWLIAGALMTSLYLFYYKAPLMTGAKILLGCLSFGLFGGMLSYLAMERKIIQRLRSIRLKRMLSPKRMFSVSNKIVFFMLTVILFMVMAILLMVFMDIHFLLTHREAAGPDIYYGVFKEILFAFVILLMLSLTILGRYSQNLKKILAIQLDAMKNISEGFYDGYVPIVSNDEFGLIADKTNHMVQGLRERDLCQMSFGKYVTPEVSEMILSGEISPEGELRHVTVLFCDLRGYTPFVERTDPKDVVKFLNAYFTEMEQTIRKHNGIVLQYIGDEIEAVFGYPIHEPDHPERAVRAALEMRQRLEGLNERGKGAGEAPIRHGVGIHTGNVLAGSVGSPDRLVYAMVGDTVNLASRIQTLNKQFQTDILISQTTKAWIDPGLYPLESLGKTAIRGKSEEVEIFQLL